MNVSCMDCVFIHGVFTQHWIKLKVLVMVSLINIYKTEIRFASYYDDT